MTRSLQLRSWRRWAAHLAALLVFVSGLMSAGTAYAFCPHAKRVMHSHRCCGAKHATNAEKARPQLQRAKCCEVRTIDALPAVDASAPPVIAAAAAVLPDAPRPAITPAPAARWVRVAPAPPRSAMPIRAGPNTAAERCARLCVYLR